MVNKNEQHNHAKHYIFYVSSVVLFSYGEAAVFRNVVVFEMPSEHELERRPRLLKIQEILKCFYDSEHLWLNLNHVQFSNTCLLVK